MTSFCKTFGFHTYCIRYRGLHRIVLEKSKVDSDKKRLKVKSNGDLFSPADRSQCASPTRPSSVPVTTCRPRKVPQFPLSAPCAVKPETGTPTSHQDRLIIQEQIQRHALILLRSICIQPPFETPTLITAPFLRLTQPLKLSSSAIIWN